MPRQVMDPFQAIRRELDEVFDRFMGEGFMPMPGRQMRSISPQLDVCMEGDTLRIEADLPGIDPENVECSVQDGVLTIKGERQETTREGNGNIVQERRFGRFERRVTLPDGIDEDSLDASFEKGVLTITAHMKPGVGQQRRIQIAQAGGSKQKSDQTQKQMQAQSKTAQSGGQARQGTQDKTAGGQESGSEQQKS